MAFTFSLNNVHGDISAGLLQMKTLLKAAGWTVPQSGDGRAAGPAGDVLTTTLWGVDSDNALGNRDSWFRLVDLNGRELLFQQTSPVHTDDWVVRYSPSDGFINSADGAPTHSIAPTASDEVVLCGTQRTSAGAGYPFGGLINTSSQKWDYIIGGAAEDYAFSAVPRFSPAGNMHGGIYYDALTDAESTDLDPIVIWLPGNDVTSIGTNTNFNSNALHGETGNWQPKFPEHATRFSGNAAEPWAFQRDPSAERGMAACSLPDLMRNGVEMLNSTSFNVYDGNFDVIEGVSWYHSSLPQTAGIAGFNVAARGAYKGRSRLIVAYSGTGLNNMDTDTGETKVYQASDFGAMWTLWDGATTPIL